MTKLLFYSLPFKKTIPTPWNREPFFENWVTQSVKRFPAIYVTKRRTAMAPDPCPLEYSPHTHTMFLHIPLPSHLSRGFQSDLFASGFLSKYCMLFSSPLCVLYISPTSSIRFQGLPSHFITCYHLSQPPKLENHPLWTVREYYSTYPPYLGGRLLRMGHAVVTRTYLIFTERITLIWILKTLGVWVGTSFMSLGIGTCKGFLQTR
jgi:hypothetical protein